MILKKSNKIIAAQGSYAPRYSGYTTPSSGFDLKKGAGGVGMAMNMISNSGILDTENKGLGIGGDGATSKMGQTIASQLGPWGMLASGVMSLGSKVAQKVGQADEYGVMKNADAATAITALTNPLNFVDALVSAKGKDGYMKKGEWNVAKIGQDFAKDKRTAGEQYKANVKLYNKIETNKNQRKQEYGSYMNNLSAAANIYMGKKGFSLERLTKIKGLQEGNKIEAKQKGGRAIETKEVSTDTTEKSIIPDGVMHGENNNLGDSGLPIVDASGVKHIEIEKKEFILRGIQSDKIEELIEQYNSIKDKKSNEAMELAKTIGEIMYNEMQDNTLSYVPEYICLNDNSCAIKN